MTFSGTRSCIQFAQCCIYILIRSMCRLLPKHYHFLAGVDVKTRSLVFDLHSNILIWSLSCDCLAICMMFRYWQSFSWQIRANSFGKNLCEQPFIPWTIPVLQSPCLNFIDISFNKFTGSLPEILFAATNNDGCTHPVLFASEIYFLSYWNSLDHSGIAIALLEFYRYFIQ